MHESDGVVAAAAEGLAEEVGIDHLAHRHDDLVGLEAVRLRDGVEALGEGAVDEVENAVGDGGDDGGFHEERRAACGGDDRGGGAEDLLQRRGDSVVGGAEVGGAVSDRRAQLRFADSLQHVGGAGEEEADGIVGGAA